MTHHKTASDAPHAPRRLPPPPGRGATGGGGWGRGLVRQPRSPVENPRVARPHMHAFLRAERAACKRAPSANRRPPGRGPAAAGGIAGCTSGRTQPARPPLRGACTPGAQAAAGWIAGRRRADPTCTPSHTRSVQRASVHPRPTAAHGGPPAQPSLLRFHIQPRIHMTILRGFDPPQGGFE